MFETYFPIFVVLILATLTGLGMLAMSHFMGTRHKTRAKGAPYECGIVPQTDARQRLPIKFYLIALLFIVFELETVFLFPWAIVYKKLGLFGLIEMGVFIFILLVGYFYLLKKGALQWE